MPEHARRRRGPIMTRKPRAATGRVLLLSVAMLLAWAPRPAPAAEAAAPDGDKLLSMAINNWIGIVEPPRGTEPKTFQLKARVVKAEGVAREVSGATAELAVQAPDKLRVTATVAGQTYSAGRDGQELWAHEPSKKFAVHGKPGLPRFKADPNSIDTTVLPPFSL